MFQSSPPMQPAIGRPLQSCRQALSDLSHRMRRSPAKGLLLAAQIDTMRHENAALVARVVEVGAPPAWAGQFEQQQAAV